MKASSEALPDATIFPEQPSILYVVNEAGWYDRIQNATSRVMPLYFENLQEWPVLTKSSTSCVIGGLGDLLAQFLEISFLASSNHYDLYRALSVSLEGLLVSGPLMHYFYEFLESVIPVESADTSNLEKWLIVIFQVLLDCLLMNFIYVATLMITTAILEGRIRQITAELKLEYWNGVKISWASSLCFAPMQCFLFRYIPVVYRVLAMNLQDIVWNASVSYVAHRSRKKDPVKKKND
eukprot:CAMPEP_0119015788 /NCGR_PEP_ID=MMETSP1176-20130426/11628_1 /TAXON_ID=265551 /ORGANISM="Synedropsis recta cf, Strain CCMP1620" /LENGTH=236 /DNA_ID=CAMNT_0006969109 /DNA_START=210 /DNA_END=920 /DNA_ORIENTATION=+